MRIPNREDKRRRVIEEIRLREGKISKSYLRLNLGIKNKEFNVLVRELIDEGLVKVRTRKPPVKCQRLRTYYRWVGE